jgi:hypothetical protein
VLEIQGLGIPDGVSARLLSEVVAALDAVEATEAKQPKRQEPHPVPATPSDPHPTTATAGTPWRLVLLEKKGSERVFGDRFQTEPECEATALHFYLPFRCELEAATIAPWQSPEPPEPQAAPNPPTAGNTEQSPTPEPTRQSPDSLPAKYWRIVATSLVAAPLEVCERAATKAREQRPGWTVRCENDDERHWRLTARSINASASRKYCEKVVADAREKYPAWKVQCEID